MNDVHRKRMKKSDKELKSNEGFALHIHQQKQLQTV